MGKKKDKNDLIQEIISMLTRLSDRELTLIYMTICGIMGRR